MSSSTVWKLTNLKQFIDGLDPSLHRLSRTVDSLARGADICDFHVRACRDLLEPFETTTGNALPLKRILSGGETRFLAEQDMLAAEAHLISAINAARSLFDVFSNLVNGLLLNTKLTERNCSVENVAKALPACELKAELNSLVQGAVFQYLVAFINTSKHLTLVKHQYRLLPDQGRGGVSVLAFTYKGKQYPEQWAYEVLAAAHELKNALPALGNTLNRALNVPDAPSTGPAPAKLFIELRP